MEPGRPSSPSRDPEAFLTQARARVAERRQHHEYPPELEAQLAEHFDWIASHPRGPDLEPIDAAMARIDALPGLAAGRIATTSRSPVGRVVHKIMGKLARRQTEGILAQTQEYAEATTQALRALADALGDPRTHVHADLLDIAGVLTSRLAAYERSPELSPAGVAELNRRVEQIERRESRQQLQPWFSKTRFEALFRGTEEDLSARYRDLVSVFANVSPVADIGCGRGEFLSLLLEAGIEACGIELDEELAAAGSRGGLPIEQGDGMLWLAQAADASLGGIALIQVIEHLAKQDVLDLVLLARDKLCPGGHVVIETPNPQSLYVFARAFYLDPDHTTPVHPAYLTFLFEEAGFSGVQILWRSLPPTSDRLVEIGNGEMAQEPCASEPASSAELTNVQRLNRLLFAPQDYALIATR